ncbi:MAG: hypothetical protein NC123_13065 [Butyrivibrio sp.]|nr:hypothetical protein [Acetatifactor muris]MCM1558088.1 hypothetical protein [Butyrivibrio sp.]MCM1560451.1 hypothetical protein [Butyrivibrio sp.]
MGVILFAVFTVMEIALTVLGFTKYRSLWRRNRLFFRGTEFVLMLLVMLLPVTGTKWRFTGCLVILGIRLAISCIAYFVKRGGTKKERTTGKAIFGMVMSIIVIGFSLFPAFIFADYSGLKTSGQYEVKETQAILIDSSRLETRENDGSCREIPIHLYYPDGDAADCPLVLFAHGSFGYYQSNYSLYAELVSNGYVVASIDHPYYAFFTKDTAGKTIIVDFEFMQNAVNMQYSSDFTETEKDYDIICEWMSIRTADENFVLDSIKVAKESGSLDAAWYTESEEKKAEILKALEMTDTEKIGLTGHSIGGAAAVQLGRERDDITAVIDIDGTMLGEQISFTDGKIGYNPDPYPIPILSLDNASHWESYAGDGETVYVNTYLLDNAVCAREAHFDGTEHMDFTDLPLFAPALAKMLGKGEVDPTEFIPKVNGIILEFFDYYLKGEGEPSIELWNAQTTEKQVYCK